MIGNLNLLGQVFINLISNAIKYSPNATTVEIDLAASPKTSPETVTISVRDYGLAIPRELHGKIFERFYRTADPKQKAIPGLGMGLHIAAEIIKRHGGTITVESAVGKGSTFTVTLPCKGVTGGGPTFTVTLPDKGATGEGSSERHGENIGRAWGEHGE